MTRSIIFLGLGFLLASDSAEAVQYLPSQTKIKALKVTLTNQMGMELGAALSPEDQVTGKLCQLKAIGSLKSKITADSGTRYHLAHHGVPVGSTDPIIYWSLTARNWTSNPHVIILRCNTPRDFSLTTGEIEKDLAGAVRFYKR